MSHLIEQTEQRFPLTWAEIEWGKVERNVRRLQERIYRASQQQDWRRVRSLQKLLVNSWSNKLLSIRQVTQENEGKGTAGIDGQLYETSAKRLALSQELKPLNQHQPLPVRRVYIPKANGQRRPLGIPTQKDRVQQARLKRALEAEWEAKFEANSYGFRPGRRCQDAIEQLFCGLRGKKGCQWVLEADIKGCFDHTC
jgi:RNA-directed DNA polymerase